MKVDSRLIPEHDLYLFNNGKLKRAWKWFGAHPVDGGVRFAVWAPYARRVGVSGDFNDWQPQRLDPRGSTGVWEGIVENAEPGHHYKYDLIDSVGGKRQKTDPFAFRMEVRPKTASLVWPLDGYAWSDEDWLATRAERQALDRPISIYEVHLGSWRHGRSYQDLATELVEYVVNMGFTHIELLPVMEFPYDPSWGYQVCGYFAATSRYGTPQDLMALVDACHRAGIGVIVDWVPAHFPKDDHGLARFDGTRLYEHEDPRRGVHMDWDTLIFNYGRPETRNFLQSNALFWLEMFHVDGLRVDAVASMLYRDFGREGSDWVPNDEGGNEDHDAIEFLRGMNDLVHGELPGVLMIAEESTAFPGVTQPTANNGLGFDLKWNMGWMHDSLAFMQEDPVYRKFHHDRLTFALYYAFHEHYLSPLSHDEVVHLKKSLLDKMPGDTWRKLANLRLLHAWQAAHPGKTLLFMGGEFGQWREWDFAGELEWERLEEPGHAGVKLLVRDLNHLVREYACLHELDGDYRGFEWVDFSDVDQSVISFLRWSEAKKTAMLFAFNFTPVVRSAYEIGVPRSGTYKEVLNTDSACYGGSGVGNLGQVKAVAKQRHGHDYTVALTLPPLGAVALAVPAYTGRRKTAL